MFQKAKWMWVEKDCSPDILILTLGQNVEQKYKDSAIFWMATATTGGTFLSYGIGTLFAINKSLFWYTFLVSSIFLLGAALIWFFSIRKVGNTCVSNNVETSENIDNKKEQKRKSLGVFLLFGLFAEFAITSLAISGGLRQWIPKFFEKKE